MRKFIWVLMVVALVVVAFETFRREAPFPSTDTSYVTGMVQTLLSGFGH